MSQKELSKFMSEYVKRNKCRGAYLVIEPASDDTRIRPYSVINEATHGKRKTSTTYQIKEAELKVTFEKVTNEEGEVDEVPNVKVIAVGAVVDVGLKEDRGRFSQLRSAVIIGNGVGLTVIVEAVGVRGAA